MQNEEIKSEILKNTKNILQNYEPERKSQLFRLLKEEVLIFIVCCGCAYAFYYFMWVVKNLPNFVYFLSLIAISGAFFSVIYLFVNPECRNKEFKQYLKKICTKNIIKICKLKSLNGKRTDIETLHKSGLFSTFNRYEHDDVINGEYNGVEFSIEEIELRQVSNSGRHSTDFQAFKGVIIKFPSNKKIRAHTLITTKGDMNIRNYDTGMKFVIPYIILVAAIPIFVFGIPVLKIMYPIFIKVGFETLVQIFLNTLSFLITPAILIGIIIYRYIRNHKKLENVSLEDISFDKRFNVYSKNQIEARYLLTPSFMEKLNNLQTSFGTRNIKCSFFDNKIIFAISTKKDLFEIGSLFSPLTTPKLIYKFVDELASIYDIIDYFKLAEKTGL